MAAKKTKGRGVASRRVKSRKGTIEATPKQPAKAQQPSSPSKSLKFAMTDLGNARRLVANHGKDLRYCKAWGKWLVWTGKRWQPDRTDEIKRRAKSTVDSMKAEAKSMDEEDRDKLLRHCRESQSASRLDAMCRVAESEPEVVVAPEKLDRDLFLLNCKNGTVDLRTEVLRQHSREDLLTKLAPVEFSESATCPVFDAFLNRITGGDNDLARYLQRCVGYCLTGK
jgi:putative DNA primase/helicase